MSKNIVERNHDYLLKKNDDNFEKEYRLARFETVIHELLKESLKEIIDEVVPEELKEYFEGVDIDVMY